MCCAAVTSWHSKFKGETCREDSRGDGANLAASGTNWHHVPEAISTSIPNTAELSASLGNSESKRWALIKPSSPASISEETHLVNLAAAAGRKEELFALGSNKSP
ncbi:hypothetical protein BST61_g3553 [Cercospora zeina]